MVVYGLFILVTAWLRGCCGAATAPNHERGPYCISLAGGGGWGTKFKSGSTVSVECVSLLHCCQVEKSKVELLYKWITVCTTLAVH